MISSDFETYEAEQHAQIKQRFEKFYLESLKPFLQEKEQPRQKYVYHFWTLILFSAFLFPMLILVAYFLNHYKGANINEGLFGIIFAIIIYIIRAPYVKYRKTVKNDVMRLFVSFFDDFQYGGGQGLSADEMRKSRLFLPFDNAEADDCFSGTYQGVHIRVAEEILSRNIETRKGTRRQNVFRGIVVELDMNKPFKGETIALVDVGLLNMFRKYEGLENVKLEDVAFEKSFEIYSTDQIEARYLLTPAFMERIFKLQKLFAGKKISVGFKNQKIMIVADTKEDMFEPCSFFKTNINKEKIDKVFEEFWTVFSIVHLLKLNEHI